MAPQNFCHFSKYRVGALLLSIVILSIQFNSLNGDIGGDGDIIDEVMMETLQEQHAEQEAEVEFDKIVGQDVENAAEAEREAKNLLNRKKNIKPTIKPKSGFRSPQGASDMMKKRGVRDKVSSVVSDRRSRVPETSRPGTPNESNGITFEDYAASVLKEEEQDEVKTAEDEARKASRELLDDSSRAQHRAHVHAVLKASGGGQSVYGDKGGGDWYQVLGVKKGEDDVGAIKRQVHRL